MNISTLIFSPAERAKIYSLSQLLVLLLITTFSLQAQVWIEDFDGSNTSNPPVLTGACADTGTDYFGVFDDSTISASFTNSAGMYLAAQDTNDGDCPGGGTDNVAADFAGINVAGETGLIICFDVAEDTAGNGDEDWDAGSSVTISVSIDGGTSEVPFVLEAVGGTNTAPGFDCDGDGLADGEPITDTFTTYCAPIMATGNSMNINIAIDELNDGDEDVAIDNIAIYSDANGTPPSTNSGCPVVDCPGLGNFGDSCDDSDPLTENDVVQNDCTCAGMPTGLADCGEPTWEPVSVVENTGGSPVWAPITGGWSMNGFCGGGCAEQTDQWLVFGPLDMSATSTLNLNFDSAEGFGTTDLNLYYTSDYSSACPADASWTSTGTITDPGAQSVDFSAATGTAVYIAIEYSDDGADGYSNWDLTNFALLADVCPTVGTPVVSMCAPECAIVEFASVSCDANTAGNDPYTAVFTVTLNDPGPFTVSVTNGNGTPSVTSISGSGAVTVTGATEGTDVILEIDNGNGCIVSATATTPVCMEAGMSGLYISELSYNPCTAQGPDGDCEYVIITNGGSTTEDLSGYTIADIGFTFPAGTMLAPGQSISVGRTVNCTGLAAFDLAGGWGGSLGNGGETVTLSDDTGASVSEVTYDGVIADGDCMAVCFDESGNASACASSLDTGGACMVSGVVVTAGSIVCNGDDATYQVCATVAGGSGDYDLVDTDNGNSVILALTGQLNDGVVCFDVIMTGPTTGTAINVDVVDNADDMCAGGSPVSVAIPTCPEPAGCTDAEIITFPANGN